jgi:4'-phosphopantetheinyl transferase
VNEKCGFCGPGEVHVWIARLPSAQPPEIATILSHDERDRASRFHSMKDRARYVFAHAVLRNVLSRYVDHTPQDIQFARNPFGKPFVDETRGIAPEFNLSHAGELVLVGVCDSQRVGIDVEEIRPMDDVSSIAESHYTQQECAFIFGKPPEHRELAFFHCWTRKEAYVKALGKGLSIPLNSFETLSQAGFGQSADSGSDSPYNESWQLADLDVPEGYVAAVAVETGIDRLVYFEWRMSLTC